MTGEWPKNEIDHIKGKSNKISDLRGATSAQNSQNIRGASLNRTAIRLK
jgi:hypothetical protein